MVNKSKNIKTYKAERRVQRKSRKHKSRRSPARKRSKSRKHKSRRSPARKRSKSRRKSRKHKTHRTSRKSNQIKTYKLDSDPYPEFDPDNFTVSDYAPVFSNLGLLMADVHGWYEWPDGEWWWRVPGAGATRTYSRQRRKRLC